MALLQGIKKLFGPLPYDQDCVSSSDTSVEENGTRFFGVNSRY